MKFSQETLMAYADGELDAPARRTVEEAMAQDPQLAREIERHRALRARLSSALSGVLAEPVPSRLLDSARTAPAGSGAAVDLAAARERKARAAAKRRWSWPEWTAIAASVLLGIFAGRATLFAPGTAGSSSIVAAGSDGLVATGALAEALSEQPGGQAGAPIDVVLSFRAKSGEYCRTFTTAQPGALAGFACREEGGWQVRVLSQGEPGSGAGQLRMAGTALPRPVLDAVTQLIEGEALDREQEAAARARGWR